MAPICHVFYTLLSLGCKPRGSDSGQTDAEKDKHYDQDAMYVLVEFFEPDSGEALVPVDLVHPFIQAVDNLFCEFIYLFIYLFM